MTNPYPLPRFLRETAILNGSGAVKYGPFDGFQTFDVSDIEVWAITPPESRFSLRAVTVEKVSGMPFDFFTVTFPAAIGAGTRWLVRSVRLQERNAGVNNGTRLDMYALEKELSVQGTILQELRRDVGRAWRSEFGEPGMVMDPGIADGRVLMKNGNRIVPGPDADEIAKAQGYSELAALSAQQAVEAAANATVPIYGTVQGLLGQVIPIGVTEIRLNGYAVKGDGYGWPLAKSVANAGALGPHQRLSDGGARRWQFAARAEEFDVRMFGGGDDDIALNNNALDAFVALYGRVGARMKLPRRGAGIYKFDNTVIVDFDGILLDPEDRKIRLHGRVYIPSLTATKTIVMDLDVPGQGRYDFEVTNWGQQAASDKRHWMSAGEIDDDMPFDFNVASSWFAKISAAGGANTPSADASWASTFIDATINLAVDGDMHLVLRPALGGQEISTVFSAGAFKRIVFFKYTAGWVAVVFGAAADGAIIYTKANGQPMSTSTPFFWKGATTHLSWSPENSLFTARMVNDTIVSVLLNGAEVLGGDYRPVGLGRCEAMGFGVQATAVPINGVKLEYWSGRKKSRADGKAGVRLLVGGDSQRAASIPDNFAEILARTLEYNFGIAVEKVVNYAVAGHNSGDQLIKLQNLGLAGCNMASFNVGTNDAQGGADASVTINNLVTMHNIITGGGARATYTVPWMWYPPELNFLGKGLPTFNYEKFARTRAAIMRFCAQLGQKLTDMTQKLPPIVADYTNPAVGARDLLVKDGLHGTAVTNQVAAVAEARAIAGVWNPPMTCKSAQAQLPELGYLQNSWIFYIPSPLVAGVDGDGWVTFGGSLSGGAKANGTVIYTLPRNLRPKTSVVARAFDDVGTNVTVNISSAGDITIFGMAGTGTGTILQIPPISWQSSAYIA